MTDRDCPISERCLRVSGVGACSLPEETNCPARACPSGTVCLSGACASSCTTDADCPGGPCIDVTVGTTTVRGCGDARATDAGSSDAGILDASPSDAPASDAADAGAGLLQIVAGTRTACVLTPGGVVYCWGGNSQAMLGDQVSMHDGPCTDADGMVPDYSHLATQVQFLAGPTQIAVGSDHACALMPGPSMLGEVYCWGDNGAGQLGSTTMTGLSDTPIPVTTGAGAHVTGVRQLRAAGNSTLLLTDTAFIGCGDGFDGQLGIDNMSGFNDPAIAVPLPAGLTITDYDITKAGAAIDAHGVVHTWGRNDHGALGIGTIDGLVHEGFAAITGITGALAIDHGFMAACARTATEVDCWGYPWAALGRDGDHSLCADVEGSGCAAPIVGLPPMAIVDVGMAQSSVCVVVANGDVWCTGGPTPEHMTRRTDLPPMRVIDGGNEFYCGISRNEHVFCWGRGQCGQTGSTTGTDNDPANEIMVP